MDDPDAGALVEAALRHDDEAARELVRRLYPLVAKIVHHIGRARTSEEDLCQMIFIRMFQNLNQFSGKVPLEHWVSRIAVNTCLNQIESEKVRPEVRHADLSEEEQAVVRKLAASLRSWRRTSVASRQLVEHLLDLLKPAERLVIDLALLAGALHRGNPQIHRLERCAGESARLSRATKNERPARENFSEGKLMKDVELEVDRLLRAAARPARRRRLKRHSDSRHAWWPFGADCNRRVDGLTRTGAPGCAHRGGGINYCRGGCVSPDQQNRKQRAIHQ